MKSYFYKNKRQDFLSLMSEALPQSPQIGSMNGFGKIELLLKQQKTISSFVAKFLILTPEKLFF